MAKKSPRILVGLVCKVCGFQGYTKSKNRMNTDQPLALTKFCKRCNKHTEHKEKKKIG